MPVSPDDLLQLSRDLLAMNGGEALQRCVVSRAYYATLHAVDAAFPRSQDSVRIDGESSHAEIINRAATYGRSLKPGRSNAAIVAQALPRLRRFRNHADYRLQEPLSPRDYADVVTRAERVLQLCKEVEQKRLKAADEEIASPPLAIQAEPPVDASKVVGPGSPDQASAPRPSLTRIK